MKRDMDLIRDLLLEIEGVDRYETISLKKLIQRYFKSKKVAEADRDAGEEKINYHIMLLNEADLIRCEVNKTVIHESRRIDNSRTMKDQSVERQEIWKIQGLTWEGYEYLESVRDAQIWKMSKKSVKEVGVFSFEVTKAIAKGIVKNKLKQHAGIELD